ncbi:interleukin 17 receptor A1a isoform X2 [Thalassophryne amazonica]|nr:interleukin 17 receptor A1a isoform X2 [Thalassophryne amazonica]
MDKGWLLVSNYTPSGPEDLNVMVDTRRDEAGRLHPVLAAHWKIKDDGSISYLKATELHVLVVATNQNLCVRYSFKDKLSMRNPAMEKWSFSADMVVVDPGQQYRVSIFNVPKPEHGHTDYNVNADVIVPGCQEGRMRETRVCVQSGSLWQPDIRVTHLAAAAAPAALTVCFNTDRLAHEYFVLVRCSDVQQCQRAHKDNQTALNVTFNLDQWPQSCCQFVVEIKPIFPQCGQDCVRQRTSHNICPEPQPTDAPDASSYVLVTVAVVFLFGAIGFVVCVMCRNRPVKPGDPVLLQAGEKQRQYPLKQTPKVLVIYSQDHYLYRDIVLKLCAFLQAKCGTKVLVDLLDSTSVGMVGRLRWLEWQRQQLKNPADKILVLCSRGVQAKWKAMCGEGQVTLREDVLSPTDDMLIPFLNLFLPDMHHTGMLGKYMVAYFEDVSGEEDVPSVFGIGVKYKLMKHFEDLYFRILDIEKYQPGQVNHIEGISGDEYSNCPSGSTLKDAIEAFQTYQLENPDWFQTQCVESEEDLRTENEMIMAQVQIPPVLEYVPLLREGPPACMHEVEINEKGNNIHVITPEPNPGYKPTPVTELRPVMNLTSSFSLEDDLTSQLYLHKPSTEASWMYDPLLNSPPQSEGRGNPSEEEALSQIPTDDEDEEGLLSVNHFCHQIGRRSSVLQNSLESSLPEESFTDLRDEFVFHPETSHSQAVEVEEPEAMEPSEKGPSSGSDQGYMSKLSSQHEAPLTADPLAALVRLQEELFESNHLES